MIRSFVRLVSVDPGFETHGVLTFQLSVPRYRFEEPARWDAVTEVVLERVGAVPGVEAVAASSWTPLSRAWAGAQMSIEATSGDVVEREQWPLILGVTRRCCMIPDNPKGISKLRFWGKNRRINGISELTSIHATTPLNDKLEQHLELLRCHYNFVRPHRALKFGSETRTPAMQAGLTTRRLTLREVFVCTRTSASILIEYDVITFGCARRQATDTSIQMPVAA